MLNPYLQYFHEDLRREWLAELNHQAQLEEARRENLQSQMEYQNRNKKQNPPENPPSQGPRGLLKAAFSLLGGHKVATTTR